MISFLPPWRVLLYVLTLTILAGVCCFYRLSEGTLFGDEAAFACTTERMRTTGDWVVPRITNAPHLNATPLYNWLTLALTPWLEPTPFLYRFCSALMAVGCVIMAFALGTVWFRAEVGFLAGLFLVSNRGFLFDHAARFGGMDVMLAFFVSGAILCYAWLQTHTGHAWTAWGFLGFCIGLACLTKPPVFAGYFFSLLVIHWFGTRRGESLRLRLAGPLLATGACVLIAAPWYILLWSRLGNDSLHALFVHNSAERALDPRGRDFLCCHHGIWHASNGFKFIEVALLFGLACSLMNRSRQPWGLLLWLVGGYLFALTAVGRAGNYIYYVFPLLAVLLAALFLESGPQLLTRWHPRLTRSAAPIGLATALGLLGTDLPRVASGLVHPAWVHPPVGIYERLAPELTQRSCHLVLFDFPSPDGATPSGRPYLNFEDLYYTSRMPLVDRVEDVRKLTQLLADGKPAVVLLPPLSASLPNCRGLCPQTQTQANKWPCYTYPVLTFHGADARFRPAELVRLARGSQS